ncbi:GNAT family N-acetyltransferase [Sporosalibacterium faouarense]|uniref:GNAT family N-acetyltransferase n=1 Tax=Sporosalibacterium faouarense TaxID=516123 RepID=UPI00192B819B|nr:GNAT family N-acetyltransferase [Sporosalibacterium faouarense]
MELRYINFEKDKDIILKFRRDTHIISNGAEEGFDEDAYLNRMRRRINKFPNGQLIVEKDNKAIGQLGLLVRDYCGKSIGYINLIYLIPEYRARGYGREMLKYAEEFFRKLSLNEYHLRVSSTNKNAFEFYRNFGMKKICEENRKNKVFLMGKVLDK